MGAQPDNEGPKEITPLMWACKRGHTIVAKYLIANGAKIEKISPECIIFLYP